VGVRDPVPLDEPSEFVGEWWRPEAPDNIASGRLRYHPENGLSLELISAGAFVHFEDDCPWILGYSVEGRPITLRNSFVSNWKQHIPGGVEVELHANQAFIGMHATSEQELRFHHLRARMTNLVGWLGVTGIQTPVAGRGAGSLKYRRPQPILLSRARGARISAEFDFTGVASPAVNPLRFEIEQEAWIRVTRARGRAFDDLLEPLGRFRGFLTFATSANATLLETRGETSVRVPASFGRPATVSLEPVWILFTRSNPRVETVGAPFMTFRFSDVRRANLSPIARWFRRAPLLEPVYNLYLSALPTQPLQAEYRFLAFAQSLETLHTRKHPRSTAAFIRKIEDHVDGLPTRLRAHVPNHFCELTRDTRNYFTHWNPRLERKAAHGLRLHHLTNCTRILLEVTLLLELGFSKTQCVRLVEHNNRLVRAFSSFLEI
jgi:hypothetical protein